MLLVVFVVVVPAVVAVVLVSGDSNYNLCVCISCLHVVRCSHLLLTR